MPNAELIFYNCKFWVAPAMNAAAFRFIIDGCYIPPPIMNCCYCILRFSSYGGGFGLFFYLIRFILSSRVSSFLICAFPAACSGTKWGWILLFIVTRVALEFRTNDYPTLFEDGAWFYYGRRTPLSPLFTTKLVDVPGETSLINADFMLPPEFPLCTIAECMGGPDPRS